MLKKFLGKDPDVVFAYQTERILRIKDLLMALIGYFFTFAVIIYIVLYVFIILQKYNVKGVWSGYVFYRVRGKGYSESNGDTTIWDHGDLLYPEQDSRGLMLGISVEEIIGQEIDYCLLPCYSNSDCPASSSPGDCTSNGYCNLPSWCPSIDSNATETVITQVKNVENFVLEIWAGINFPVFSSDDYTSYGAKESVPYPKSEATSYLVSDILYEAGINSIDEIQETGVIIGMQYIWKCDTDKPTCTPEVKFSREDNGELETTFR